MWVRIPPRALVTTLMYTKPHCPYCAAARDDMQARGEAYEERDATTNPAWKAELMDHSRNTGLVPTIVRDERDVQVGFPPGKG
jgi:glutaredoxin 3